MNTISTAVRNEVVDATRRANKLIVWKARLPPPNEDGWRFFTAPSAYRAEKRVSELGLVGRARRATRADLSVIAVRALEDF